MITVDILIEQIRRILTDDMADNGLIPTQREILIHISQGLAYAMKESFYEGVKFDDVLYANDQYNFNVKNLTVLSEDDYKFITLPAVPIELPRGRSIVSIRPNGSIKNSYIPIQRKDLDIMLGHSRNKNKKQVVYFQECNLVKFVAFGGASVAKFIDATIVAPGALQIGGILMVSEDTQVKIIDYVLSVYGKKRDQIEDQNTDGINTV